MEPPLPTGSWERLPTSLRQFVLVAAIAGPAFVGAMTVWWAVIVLGSGSEADGIRFLPLVLSVVAYGILIGVAALLVARSAGPDPGDLALARLGNVWVLASIPLMFDFLIDSFPGKLAINVLFLVAGIRYWKGRRNSYLSLLLAPLTALIAVADGFGHLQGAFCSGSALDACPAKAVSDFYLVMILLGVTAVTVTGRTERPDPRKLVLAVLAIVVVLVVFAFAPI